MLKFKVEHVRENKFINKQLSLKTFREKGLNTSTKFIYIAHGLHYLFVILEMRDSRRNDKNAPTEYNFSREICEFFIFQNSSFLIKCNKYKNHYIIYFYFLREK